jgi:hypothetical protein
MADTLEGLRNQILDSVKGRKMGLDPNGFLVGPPDIRQPITAATSLTTGTVIPAYGLTTIQGPAGTTWTLAAPIPGVIKHITAITTLLTAAVAVASGTILSSGSAIASTLTRLTFDSSYANTVRLYGRSTSQYVLLDPLTSSVVIS